MLGNNTGKMYPSVNKLVTNRIASRIHSKDATVYSFNDEAQQCAENFMGWTTLGTMPPTPIQEIIDFADKCHEEGYTNILLIGEGGSTQAPMTFTKYNSVDTEMKFRTLDSVSPVRVRSIMASVDIEHLLVIVSSKSGGTIEPMSNLIAVRSIMAETMSENKISSHLIAITDPGSDLEKKATDEKWKKIFHGEPTVGGRYSALSVFGLVPAALAGIDIEKLNHRAVAAELNCAEDSVDNPAIRLASFMYDNWRIGRDKICFLSPKRGRVLGLWIEQLVAESLGKNGKGILPNIDPDALDLEPPSIDRTAIIYRTHTDLWDERMNFEMGLSAIDSNVPITDFKIDSVYDLAEDFTIWEYAVAMCGYLMEECPFDQPDVASAKAATLEVLNGGKNKPDITVDSINGVYVGDVDIWVSDVLNVEDKSLDGVLRSLFSSIKGGDYVAINAFIPFAGEGRRESLDALRHTFANRFQTVSCLEIGPRYLHSTGQLQKGGANNGVFLIISADELKDIKLGDWKATSLATLEKSQAQGDLQVLSKRGRRAVLINLPDNTGTTLRRLASTVDRIAAEVTEW